MSKKKLICTYFDQNYLPRGLALIDSLFKHNNDLQLVVLCLDENTYEFLNKKYNCVSPIHVKEYISYFKIDQTRFRSKKEFYFSITPNLCLMVLNKYPEYDILTYLDSDVYVFGNLDILYKEFGNYSIAACSHRPGKILKFFSNDFGRYNVGVNLFRNDFEGNKCLKLWKKKCDEWHPDIKGYPLSFFSDQIFLNDWPTLFKNSFKEIENIGVNVAPWNALNYSFKFRNDKYFVNEEQLLIYHFSSLIKIDNQRWNVNSGLTFFSLNKVLSIIYKNYINHLESFDLEITKYAKLNTKLSLKKKLFKILTYMFFKNTIDVKKQ